MDNKYIYIVPYLTQSHELSLTLYLILLSSIIQMTTDQQEQDIRHAMFNRESTNDFNRVFGGLAIFGLTVAAFEYFIKRPNETSKEVQTSLPLKKQIERLISEIRSERESWKAEIKSLRQLVHKGMDENRQIRLAQNSKRYKIVPLIVSATWKGLGNNGGFKWYYNSFPSYQGGSSPTTADYNRQFSKMDNYLTNLNNLKKQKITVVPNVDTLGESCKRNPKQLLLEYRCMKYDGWSDKFEESLIFRDSKYEVKTVRIAENGISIIDCLNTEQRRQ